MIENVKESDLGTNGRLRRAMALNIIKSNNRYMVLAGVIATVVAMFSGSGQGITVFGLAIPPISPEAVGLICTIVGGLIKGWQEEKSTILNHYFINDSTGKKFEGENKEGK